MELAIQYSSPPGSRYGKLEVKRDEFRTGDPYKILFSFDSIVAKHGYFILDQDFLRHIVEGTYVE